MHNSKPGPQPWYRQGWFWFLMTPLIAVFFVSGTLVTVAFYHADDVVLDNYYREGRGVNQVFEQDLRAAALELRGELRFDRTSGEVLLNLSGREALPDRVLLLMDHPVSARLDQAVELRRISSGEYRGDLEKKPQHRWYLSLLPEVLPELRSQAEWRLRADIDFAQRERVLLGASGEGGSGG